MPFCLVARLPWPASLFRLQDETLLVTTDRPALVCGKAGSCAAVPDALNVPVDLQLGQVIAAGGSWPRSVWLTQSRRASEGTQYRGVHLSGGRWREEPRAERGYFPTYQSIVTAADGRVVAIATFRVDGLHATPTQILGVGPGPVRLDVIAGPASPALPHLGAGEMPYALALLAGGESLLVVDRVKDGQAHDVVLRTSSRGTHELALPLPGGVADDDLEFAKAETSASGIVYLGGMVKSTGRAFLTRVEADAVTALEVPDAVGRIWQIALEPDETAWVIAQEGLFVRSPQGRWEHVSVTSRPCSVDEIVARAAGDVFVSGTCDPGGGARPVVLRTRCPTPVLPDR
jgi:hypothetical protein